MGSWESYLKIAIMIAGMIEHLKQYHAGKKWVWRLTQLLLAFALGLQVTHGPDWVTTSLMALSISQLYHDKLDKYIEKKLDA